MNLKQPFLQRFLALATAALLAGGAGASRAQTVLDVTKYGAKGDLLTLEAVNTVSNSATLICPVANFSGSDVGKLVEVFDAGTWRGVSNETLIATITTVNSATSVTLTAVAGRSATGLKGVYGTDNRPAFLNAVAACPLPTAVITIPEGNYFLVPAEMITGFDGVTPPSAVKFSRGGITFSGQGQVTLTGCGGWRNFGGNCIRGSLFELRAPISNDQPVVFTNLTLYGGVAGNIRDLSYPPSGSTGWGWDGTHHWLVTSGWGAMVSSIVMQDCVVHGWRGEMMEETSGWPGAYLRATNCFFYDGNGSCINNFAHTVVSCTFSNANQAEEFYRTYYTNASYMLNCTFVQLGSAIALNGGLYNSPPYTIAGNTFTNFYSGGYALMTTPACNVLFVSNRVYTAQGVALGVAGYQGSTINSNLVAAFNLFDGAQYPLQVFGTDENSTADVRFFSNQVNNAWGIGSGYGWSTNVQVFNNTGQNCGRFDMGSLKGQYFLDVGNQYNPVGLPAGGQWTNIFSYASGSLNKMNAIDSWVPDASIKFGLDDTAPAKIPPGATLTISNSASRAYSLYLNAGLTGVPLLVNPGQVVKFYWSNNIWTTNSSSKPGPPKELRAG